MVCMQEPQNWNYAQGIPYVHIIVPLCLAALSVTYGGRQVNPAGRRGTMHERRPSSRVFATDRYHIQEHGSHIHSLYRGLSNHQRSTTKQQMHGELVLWEASLDDSHYYLLVASGTNAYASLASLQVTGTCRNGKINVGHSLGSILLSAVLTLRAVAQHPCASGRVP
ncbi:hypothetical protein FB567DRAFT_137355 [Paraphoma chrysanthemicola]|uniref:Uncharacterized protein n=1 Tax=Paraphoma chrysanthemicola TaxID=798071 RepID=A0A8K0QYL1_9PLEO|nr:hypothetical protein FB567DRAFT_137355 [Paraphoma chrysanthemicola]